MSEDRFDAEADGEPAFPRVSLLDAKRRPYHPPPSHVTQLRPTNVPATPVGRGVTMRQWEDLRRYAASLRREDQ